MVENPFEDLKIASSDREDSENQPQTINGIVVDQLAGPEGGNESRRLAKFWLDQIKAVDDMQQKWVKRCDKIIKRYRDERVKSEDDGGRRFNSLWCNVEILQPALYGREPLPIVERRFRDRDPTGRAAAQILERALRNNLEISGFGFAVDLAVKDYLLPGRGAAWVRYEPEIGPGISIPNENSVDMSDSQGTIESDEQEEEENPIEEKLEDTGDRVLRESAPVDYVSWADFYIFPAKARIWKEVTAVGKRCYMTKDQLTERFGEEIGKNIPMAQREKTRRNPGQETSQFYNDQDARKGEVFEIWSRQDRSVYWVAEGYAFLADRKDDPLELEHFFPVPPPLQANTTSDSMVPVPDYIQYQDQALQIDELTQRLAKLTQACKIVGVYNAQAKGIQRLLKEGVENELIPVDQWAAFAEKGGIAGQISMLPLKEVIGVINEITGVRQRVMADMDRLTGITDIMRGTTDARETMGAQRLKTNGSSTRLQKRQDYVAKFCKNIIELQAEVIAKHFSVQTLIDMSGAMYDESLGADRTPISVNQNAPGLAELGADQGLSPSPPDQVAGMLPPPPPPGTAGAVPPLGNPLGGPTSPMGNPMLNGGAPLLGGAGAAQTTPPLQASGAAPPNPGMAVASQPPMGGLPMLPPPHPIMLPRGLVRIAAAIDLLRNEKLRGFRIDIETDSTIYGDNQQEKNDRLEFIGAMSKFLPQAIQLGTQMPEAVPMLGKFVQFAARGFKVSRDLEAAIEDFCDMSEKKAEQAAANPQAMPPNPAQIKAESDKMNAETARMKADSELQRTQIETSGEQNRQQLENQGDLQEAQVNAEAKQAESRVAELNAENDRLHIQLEMLKEQNRQKELDLESHKAGLEVSMHSREMDDNEFQRAHEVGERLHSANQSALQHTQRMQQSALKPKPTFNAPPRKQ